MLLDTPELSPSTVSDYWVIDKAIRGVTSKGVAFTIPVGFESDLASIPSLIRNILDVNGPSRDPALEHDWSYTTAFVTKEEADENLRLNLIKSGMSAAGARTYWLGVHLFGAHAWNGHRKSGITARDFATTAEYVAWDIAGRKA